MQLITQLRANNDNGTTTSTLRPSQVKINPIKPNAIPKRQAQTNTTHERGYLAE